MFTNQSFYIYRSNYSQKSFPGKFPKKKKNSCCVVSFLPLFFQSKKKDSLFPGSCANMSFVHSCKSSPVGPSVLDDDDYYLNPETELFLLFFSLSLIVSATKQLRKQGRRKRTGMLVKACKRPSSNNTSSSPEVNLKFLRVEVKQRIRFSFQSLFCQLISLSPLFLFLFLLLCRPS